MLDCKIKLTYLSRVRTVKKDTHRIPADPLIRIGEEQSTASACPGNGQKMRWWR